MLRATRRASGFRAAAGTSARRCASGFPEASTIWKDGELIPWKEANVHILSTAVQFGSSLFEGIRCYGTPSGPAIVHLDGHLRRLLDSCKMYRVDVPYSAEELAAACFDVVEANGLHDGCYIRPMVLRGYGAVGMDGKGSPVECYIPAWKWGAYLGADAFSTGIDCCTASWARPAPNTFPGMAKAAGNYNNAALIKMEAQANGYVEAVALGSDGMVSEGSGQNLFVVRDGEIATPPINGSNLQGLTRASALQLAAEAGVPVRIEPIPREALYVADELFFTGTATEVMPIASLDRIAIGNGRRGPITERIQQRYQDIIHGRSEDVYGWMSLRGGGV
ncbi:branched-chain amino-acid aminotransferase [Emiliania huxleyi CCMP1516]|uniref:branched-chain-amino-acid transaminase n=3 Tax=Emiliania huxleyi TaxID=2903 RepID=A0A0D3IM33_EMIH1|nr:branched-chain amino-acid aminotransferase [Emiliania huxleyi CCMP1516]EOD12318.1 branched-chain amino-acid aminotransferase [Emiliania huxleyi CCMP1516]|eukprot:XP_005764747.1 branched-chain amino-acid aminotransferase [Emiliania huxleyi CCMP1516]